MATYFVSADPNAERTASVEARIRSVMPDLVTTRSVEEAASRRKRKADPICLLVLAPADNGGYLDRLIETAAKHHGRIFFILLSSEISASDYKRLVRTGNADWVDVNGGLQEILDIIGRRTSAVPSDPRSSRGPVAVVFLPSAGGVGNSTLAIETAIQLAQRKQDQGQSRRVCLVDLDFQTSHICDYLDLEPRLKIGEIVDDPERLDGQLFEIFVSRHASGIHVLAAPRRKVDVPAVDMPALDALFEKIAARYDCILIDVPVAWHGWSRHVLAAANGIVVTGANTIPGLRQISEALAVIREAAGAAPEVAVALNRCERTMFGRVARRSHVDSVLGKEKVFFVRNDATAVQCINTGVPMTLAAPSRNVVKDIAAIAGFCSRLTSSRATS
jgi:pilus assembly protein CpaE